MIVQDILAGRGVGLIDPHGDLAESILDAIPSWRTDDVVYFNPKDTDYPIGLNILECKEGQRNLVPSHVSGMFRDLYPEFWGPRLEYILSASCASLVSYGGQTLLGIHRLLTDPVFRDRVVKQIKDPFLLSFWRGEFDNYNKGFATEAIAPILNKVGRFSMSPLLRNIIGQPKSGFDVGFVMDRKRIFIADLSKGILGEEESNLLGSMLVSKFQLEAMARAAIPENLREDFMLYVDEWQNYTTESFASILEEARKYHLCLTLANQHLEQLSERLRASVLGNAGSIICFRVGNSDAEILSKELNNEFPPSRFTELPNHSVCAKLMIQGEAGQPFIGKTLPELEVYFGRKDLLIQRSREKFGMRKEHVEEKLKRWLTPKRSKFTPPRTYRRRL